MKKVFDIRSFDYIDYTYIGIFIDRKLYVCIESNNSK